MKSQMEMVIVNLNKELSKIRTSAASPNILDAICINYYGNRTPINQVANITIPEPRCINIQPWEKSLIKDITKVILEANIGVTPIANGDSIRLTVPPLTLESRQRLVKLVNGIAEKFKISIRKIRREENDKIKNSGHGSLENVQDMTDKYINFINKIIEEKEKSILTI